MDWRFFKIVVDIKKDGWFMKSHGKQCGQVGEDAIDMISFAVVGVGVLLLDEPQFCPVGAASFGRPPVDRDIPVLGHLLNMGIELVS